MKIGLELTQKAPVRRLQQLLEAGSEHQTLPWKPFSKLVLASQTPVNPKASASLPASAARKTSPSMTANRGREDLNRISGMSSDHFRSKSSSKVEARGRSLLMEQAGR